MVVKPVLCDDAPEGYMAEDAEETDEVSTKDTLSYCWRALRESSLLLATILQGLGPAQSTQIQQLSELCFTQLAELRHRGAFSTVAQTWIACCLASRDLCTELGQQLLSHWYAKVVAILRNNTTINTRRSAGLPALLCGILVADRNRTLIKQAFNDLEAIARTLVASEAEQEGSLPQVHAMNCLKDVLKNSRLAEASENYVPVALKLAADALQSSAWAVRNCGLMLFRAVIDRLLGTSDAHIDGHGQVQRQLSVNQHPQLLSVVLGLLRTPFDAPEMTMARSEGVFPALQLLQRLEVPETQAAAARRAVYALMASSQWHVREKAARTYTSLIANREACQEFERLLDTTTTSQNALHGALLSARHIMKRSPLASDDSRASILWDRRHELYTTNASPVTKAAYVDLLADFATTSGQNDADISATLASEMDALQWTSKELRKQATVAGSASTVRLALAQFLASQLLYLKNATRSLQDDIGETVTLLAKHDANACTAFVVRVATLAGSGVTCTQEVLDMLADICVNVDPAWDVTLKCETLKLLLRIGIDKHAAIVGEPRFLALTQAASVSATLLDLQLQWRAACIERCCSIATTDEAFIQEMRGWTACCTQAVVQEDSVYSWGAAALAIAHLDYAWSVLSSHPELSRDMISLCMAVYDLLNDDDEEIRMLAATATSRILAVGVRSSHQHGIQPAVASQRLLIYIVRKWSNDPDFANLAISRAFGADYVDRDSVNKQIKASMTSNTALFAEEKQNLYIDEALEINTWSQMTMNIQSTALHRAAITHLSHWTDNGLKALTAQATDPTGHSDWCSQPGIFTLGLKVTYGAECLLRLSRDGVKLGVRPSAIRRQLADLTHARELHGVHYLWQEELQRILKESVMQKLVAVHGRRLKDTHAVVNDSDKGNAVTQRRALFRARNGYKHVSSALSCFIDTTRQQRLKLSIMSHASLPSRSLAGITVPDTPLITAAIDLSRKHLNDMAFNHVMRSFLFGFAIADKIPPFQGRDRELHALAATLHDLGLDTTDTFISPDKRFEVDGANAARTFIEKETVHSGGKTWDKHRGQLLWDAIALHTTPSIAQHKEPEVAATGLGIFADFVGRDAAPGTITIEEYDAIVAKYPRQGFRNGFKEVMCGLCKTKPETTFDNFVADFGDQFVEGYTSKGHRASERIMATVD
ncbi:hypothetical protein LTR17_023761 [Elasticomyces elasticus]|nr:hypothetical protein LTR17_023761 [Elasticomyces elasticus]